MRSTTSAWVEAMQRDGADIRFHVEVWTQAGVSFEFVTGDDAIQGAPALVESVTPVETEVDPSTRQRPGGSLEMVFRVGALEPLELSTQTDDEGVIGKLVVVSLGEASIDFSDWMVVYTGVVADMREDPSGAPALIIGDPYAASADTEIVGHWIARHPRDLLDGVLALMPADVVDITTLDGDDDTTRSHWSVTHAPYIQAASVTDGEFATSAGFDMAVQASVDLMATATPMRDWIDQIVSALHMVVVHDANGMIAQRVDETPTTAARHLTANDISNVRMTGYAANRGTEYSVGYAGDIPDLWDDDHVAGIEVPSSTTGLGARDLALSDATAEAAQSWGSVFLRGTKTLDSSLLARGGAIMPPLSSLSGGINNSTTTLRLDGPSLIGFCGMRWRDGFKTASYSTFTTTGGTTTITGVSLLYGSADFVVGESISYWDGTETIHITIATYAAGTITATTVEADGSAPPGGELAYIYLSQDPLDRISADRVVYLEVRGGDGLERMQVTAVRPSRNVSAQTFDVSLASWSGYTAPAALTLTVTRGALDTTGYAATNQDVFYDVTIPVRMAQIGLARFAYGAPEVELDMDLRHADLQEGDVVSFDWPSLFARRVKATRGMNSTVLWEITRMGIDLASGKIATKLVWIATP